MGKGGDKTAGGRPPGVSDFSVIFFFFARLAGTDEGNRCDRSDGKQAMHARVRKREAPSPLIIFFRSQPQVSARAIRHIVKYSKKCLSPQHYFFGQPGVLEGQDCEIPEDELGGVALQKNGRQARLIQTCAGCSSTAAGAGFHRRRS